MIGMERLWLSDFVPESQGIQEIWEEDAKTGKKSMKMILEGEFSSSKANRNKRRIPPHVLKKNVSMLMESIRNRGGVIAENGHPQLDPNDPKSMQRAITTSFDRASGLIQHLEYDEKKEIIYGKAEILHEADCGRPIASLARRGFKVGISSRAIGSRGTVGADGITIYPDDTKIITFDFVENESNYGSILNLYEESYNSYVEQQYKKTKSLWNIYQEHLVKK